MNGASRRDALPRGVRQPADLSDPMVADVGSGHGRAGIHPWKDLAIGTKRFGAAGEVS